MKELTNLTTLNNKKILVVLPVGDLNEVYLNDCAFSLAQQEMSVDLVVLTSGLDEKELDLVKTILDKPTFKLRKQKEDGTIEEEIKEPASKLNYVIEKTSKTKFSEIFNEAFNYAIKNEYEWFSVIEQEDFLDFKWYKNFSVFAETKKEIGIFLPINREITNGVFTGFLNEACWGEGMAEEAGVFDLQLLLRFNCANITGGVCKVETLKEYSENVDGYYMPIKESIKLSCTYEFFLRMIYNDVKCYTIPRIGYERRLNRVEVVNNLSSKVPMDLTSIPKEKGGMDEKELRFWLDLAKKEYFFDEDRKEIYNPEEEQVNV
jgi:hypothetical protein